MAEPNLLNPFAEATEGDPLKGVSDGIAKELGMFAGLAGIGGQADVAKVLGAGAAGIGLGNAIAPYVFGAEPKGTSYQEIPADGNFKPTSGNQVFDTILEGGMSAFDYLNI